jgi:hypothetical protein
MPETAFYGPRASTQVIGVLPPQENNNEVTEATPEKNIQSKTDISSNVDTEASTDLIPKLTYLQTLKPWSVINPEVSLKNSFLRPWVLLA